MDGIPDVLKAKQAVARVLTSAKDPEIISAIVDDTGDLIVTLDDGDSYSLAGADYWPAEK